MLQTYLWLSHFGYDVHISANLPSEGIVVVLPEAHILDSFLRRYTSSHRGLMIATIRADVYGFRPALGDVDVTQNGRFADEERTFFIPHWPQPGLVSRNADRGTTIQNVVFKGGFGSLSEEFRTQEWYSGLERRGLQFRISSAQTEGEIPDWHDYSTADLNLAVRPSFADGGRRCEKPASKLINAWHAGVPSLLGREYAYMELRESDLDYIEVTTAKEALTAIDRLLEDRILYQRMIRRGQKRAQSFTPEKIAERWAQVLFRRAPQVAEQRFYQWSRHLPLGMRRVLNLVISRPPLFELRKRGGHLWRLARTRFL